MAINFTPRLCPFLNYYFDTSPTIPTLLESLETELNNDKWYVTAQRMGTWAQARAVQNGFDSQVNIFLVFKLEK